MISSNLYALLTASSKVAGGTTLVASIIIIGFRPSKNFCDLLLLSINQLSGKSSKSFRLCNILKDGHVALLELLKHYGFLSLDMGRDILVSKLGLEGLPCSLICHSLIRFFNRFATKCLLVHKTKKL